MAPETLFLLLSLVAAVLLALGGFLVGRVSSTARAEDTLEISRLRDAVRDAEEVALREKSAVSERLAQCERLLEEANRERGQFLSEVDTLRQRLKEAREKVLQAPDPRELEVLRARGEEWDQERKELVARVKDLEERNRRTPPTAPMRGPEPSREMEGRPRPPRPSWSPRASFGDQDMRATHEEVERLRQEVGQLQKELATSTSQSLEAAKARDDARARQEAAERIIEAARARTASLFDQLKGAQSEIARLKGSGAGE